jgi:hypothetical protein
LLFPKGRFEMNPNGFPSLFNRSIIIFPEPGNMLLRVMQARLTVIGFNLAVVSFQIGQLGSAADGLRVPGIGRAVHVVADMELYMALGLSVFALFAFINSCEFDEVGVCSHRSLLAGDLLMYLAVAHTLAGFFAPLAMSMKMVAGNLQDKATEINILQSATIAAGGGAWFLATYAGPFVALVRPPFHRRTSIALGSAYLLVLLVLCWITALTVRVESAVSGDGPGLIFSVLRELVQPLRW